MEDMARLALVEQDIRDEDNLIKIITELLHQINRILEYPHDYELRVLNSDILTNAIQSQEFVKYLAFVGFQLIGTNYTYPNKCLSNLRVAQASLQRKLYFCRGNSPEKKPRMNPHPKPPKVELKPVVLKTSNTLLQKVASLFNNILKYEDEELQDLARTQIPLMELQLKAVDRVREYQRMLKLKEVTGHDLPFDVALLIELVRWFKKKFFTWVDKPQCPRCKIPTVFSHSTEMVAARESRCLVEIFICPKCNEQCKFPRYNDPRTLLKWRRGRCGEWANCFTLLCRSLNYDTRYVYDTTDHVWCEVFDYDCNRWIHVDPCEAEIDMPLMYSHGWNKKLSYVIAVSRDDLQDVTWRYTTYHEKVQLRRNLCTEEELISAIFLLREQRQNQVNEMRRQYLTKRCLQELVQLMMERKPTDAEKHGRKSGGSAWKLERGEIGVQNNHTFVLNQPGNHSIKYFTVSDQYVFMYNNEEKQRIDGWKGGVYECENMFRKVENDWWQAYLAREEGKIDGKISWKLFTSGDSQYITLLNLRLSFKLYENGNIQWSVTFNGSETHEIRTGDTEGGKRKLGGLCKEFKGVFKEVVLTAKLSGGNGEVGWQHAQLFRQSLDLVKDSSLDIHAIVNTVKDDE